VEKVEELVSEYDGEVAVVGVGNTCGAGNTRESVSGIHNRLRKYCGEYEEKDDEDEVCYMGLMGALPGGNQAELRDMKEKVLWRMTR
jgi:hypothetical protein